jgi:hypothetical protein
MIEQHLPGRYRDERHRCSFDVCDTFWFRCDHSCRCDRVFCIGAREPGIGDAEDFVTSLEGGDACAD